MKEEIYTIPVMDGFQSDCECPFCAMYRKLESDSIGFVLSPSYMEEDVRGLTNEKGFCKLHMKQLYDRGNSLGLALMLHSHLKHRTAELNQTLEQLSTRKSSKGWFSKKAPEGSDPVRTLQQKWQNSCYICDRIEDSFSRFLSTFFHMWKKQPDFRQTVQSARGYCLDHFLMLYASAADYLKGEELDDFRSQLKKQEQDNLVRVADELEWFTLKFDYRYQNEPWKNSKDALPRTILKVNGQFVEKEKNS